MAPRSSGVSGRVTMEVLEFLVQALRRITAGRNTYCAGLHHAAGGVHAKRVLGRVPVVVQEFCAREVIRKKKLAEHQ